MIKNTTINIDEWISWIKDEKRLGQKTIRSYASDLNSFLNFLNDHYNVKPSLKIIADLNEDDLTGWFYQRLKKNISHRSNARALSSLKSFLNFLVREKKINYSEILSVKGPKFLESLPRPLTQKQVFKIVEEIKSEKKRWVMIRNLSIIFLMWGYGLRIGEVLNLQLKDINQDDLRVIGKGKKVRLIPIADELRFLIRKMIQESPFDIEKDDFIFLGEKGRKLKAEIIQRVIKQMRFKLNLPHNSTPHSFRHSFATELLQNFVDLRFIQELLGHSSLSTTQKYTSVNKKYLRDILEKNHPITD